MSDYKIDTNTNIFQNATKKLRLRFPIADIVKKTGYAKGGVSDFLNGKKPVSDEFLKKFSEAYKINLDDFKDFESEPEISNTGYYYPDVSASAGLESEMKNSELNKVPINIPGWGKDLIYINVYGDSMSPVYTSGEIIGIREIDFAYVVYGYAYVIILGNGDVYIKYVKKGQDNEHVILESENDFYEPKEFPLLHVKTFYQIKGVLTKTTM